MTKWEAGWARIRAKQAADKLLASLPPGSVVHYGADGQPTWYEIPNEGPRYSFDGARIPAAEG